MKKITTPVLTATVQLVVNGPARCPVFTGVTIWLDGAMVAVGKLWGRKSPAESLAEFRRNPGQFTLLPAAEFARSLGLIPAVKSAG